MAVAEILQLPAQPATGAVHRTPLGGDGYRAPFAAYNIDNFTLVGDGTGGSPGISFTANMDERFCTLVAYLNLSVSQTAAIDLGLRFRVDTSQASSPIAPQTQSVDAQSIPLTSNPASINEIFQPVPVILPGDGAGSLVQLTTGNIDTDIYRFSGLFYLFNIDVRQVMPMGPLLWARGAT